jgi:hypothetical protein
MWILPSRFSSVSVFCVFFRCRLALALVEDAFVTRPLVPFPGGTPAPVSILTSIDKPSNPNPNLVLCGMYLPLSHKPLVLMHLHTSAYFAVTVLLLWQMNFNITRLRAKSGPN